MTEKAKTANDLQSDAAYLAAILDGADLLFERCADEGDTGLMASNAFVAIISDARRRPQELADGLDRLDQVSRIDRADRKLAEVSACLERGDTEGAIAVLGISPTANAA